MLKGQIYRIFQQFRDQKLNASITESYPDDPLEESNYFPYYNRIKIITPFQIKVYCEDTFLNIFWYGKKTNTLKRVIRYICLCVFILNRVANKPLKRIDAHLVPINDIKQVSNTKSHLEPVNVNSGYMYMNDEISTIVVYRSEEMDKTIMHELMHAYHINCNFDLVRDIHFQNMFEIQSYPNSIRLSEAITDFFAIIFTMGIRILRENPDIQEDKFNAKYDKYFDETVLFVKHQAQVVINFYENKPWIEHSHVFSYYVAKSLLFENYEKVYQLIQKKRRITISQEDFYDLLDDIITPESFDKYKMRSLKMMPPVKVKNNYKSKPNYATVVFNV